MKKYLYLFMACSLLVSCHQEMDRECCTCESLEPCDVYAFAEGLAGLTAKPGIWDYPIKPGMEEWKQLNGREEKVRVCQIPEEALSSLSTEDLTNICLRYPLLHDVFVFTLLSTGADRLYIEFNGIRELFKRKDAAKELLKYYNFLIKNISVWDSEEEGIRKENLKFSIGELEFLLGFYMQKSDAITKEDSKKVLLCLVHGHEREIDYYDPYGSHTFFKNFYARAHVIIKISPQCIEKIPHKDQNAVFHSNVIIGRLDKETVDVINELSYQLIK